MQLWLHNSQILSQRNCDAMYISNGLLNPFTSISSMVCPCEQANVPESCHQTQRQEALLCTGQSMGSILLTILEYCPCIVTPYVGRQCVPHTTTILRDSRQIEFDEVLWAWAALCTTHFLSRHFMWSLDFIHLLAYVSKCLESDAHIVIIKGLSWGIAFQGALNSHWYALCCIMSSILYCSRYITYTSGFRWASRLRRSI